MSDEIILAIIAALTGIGGTIATYVFRRLNQYDTEKRHELEATRQQRDDLLTRVTDLEEKSKRLEFVEKQVLVLTRSLDDLLEWKDGAEIKLQARKAEIDRLRAENDRIKDQNTKLGESKMELIHQVNAFQKAFTWMGLERAESAAKTEDKTPVSSEEKSPDVPEKSEETSEEKSDNDRN